MKKQNETSKKSGSNTFFSHEHNMFIFFFKFVTTICKLHIFPMICNIRISKGYSQKFWKKTSQKCKQKTHQTQNKAKPNRYRTEKQSCSILNLRNPFDHISDIRNSVFRLAQQCYLQSHESNGSEVLLVTRLGSVLLERDDFLMKQWFLNYMEEIEKAFVVVYGY